METIFAVNISIKINGSKCNNGCLHRFIYGGAKYTGMEVLLKYYYLSYCIDVIIMWFLQ